MTHISDTDECRRLARNVINADFSDTQIESYQDKRYSQIATLTDKDDWDSADREFGILQLIETKLVASDIIEHYGDVSTIPIWQSMRASAMMDLSGQGTGSGIIDNLDTPTESAEFAAEHTEFKGWGKNESVEPPNRLGGGVADTESF